MNVKIHSPETHVTMSLEERPCGVVLVARNYDTGDEQELLFIEAEGTPTNGDPLGQRNEALRLRLIKVGDRAAGWVRTEDSGHIEVVRA